MGTPNQGDPKVNHSETTQQRIQKTQKVVYSAISKFKSQVGLYENFEFLLQILL